MFNEQKKRRFLDRVAVEERSQFERLFERVDEMEASFNKDLSECSLEELTSAFHHLAPESLGRSVKNKEYAQAYIDWCLKQSREAEDVVNPLHAYDAEWCNQFVTST